MNALVTGATGLVGRALVARLDQPRVLGRDAGRARARLGEGVRFFAWDPVAGPPPVEAASGVDAVFHLAGEPVAAGRLTAARRRAIRESRVLGTRHLVEAMARATPRPRVLVSASAIGYYGDRGDEPLFESSLPGDDFLAEVCVAWEAEAARARDLGVRVVTARIGVVLAPEGGALARMLPPFRLGLGGPLGSGRQWMSFVHLDDVAGLLLHAAARDDIDGPMNTVAPTPVRNRDFARALGAALRRPARLRTPRFALRTAFGDLADVLLASQRVVPEVAASTGYAFRYPDVTGALAACVAREP